MSDRRSPQEPGRELKKDAPQNPLLAYRWVGSLIVLGLGITLMINAL